jgi:hypothetical protein
MWSSLAIVVRKGYTTCGCGERAGIGLATLAASQPSKKWTSFTAKAGLSARGLVEWVERSETHDRRAARTGR